MSSSPPPPPPPPTRPPTPMPDLEDIPPCGDDESQNNGPIIHVEERTTTASDVKVPVSMSMPTTNGIPDSLMSGLPSVDKMTQMFQQFGLGDIFSQISESKGDPAKLQNLLQGLSAMIPSLAARGAGAGAVVGGDNENDDDDDEDEDDEENGEGEGEGDMEGDTNDDVGCCAHDHGQGHDEDDGDDENEEEGDEGDEDEDEEKEEEDDEEDDAVVKPTKDDHEVKDPHLNDSDLD